MIELLTIISHFFLFEKGFFEKSVTLQIILNKDLPNTKKYVIIKFMTVPKKEIFYL